TSSEVILGPVKIRVLSMRSPTGAHNLSVANPDNSEGGEGAVWDFTSVLNGGRLRPGERSGAKRLEFRLVAVPPLDVDWISDYGWGHRGRDRVGIVNIDTKVLGRIEK